MIVLRESFRAEGSVCNKFIGSEHDGSLFRDKYTHVCVKYTYVCVTVLSLQYIM